MAAGVKNEGMGERTIDASAERGYNQNEHNREYTGKGTGIHPGFRQTSRIHTEGKAMWKKTGKITLILMLAVLLAGSFILPARAEEPEETITPNMRVVNCKKDVSLREKPSTSSRRLARVPLGAEVTAWRDGGSDDEEAERFLYCEYGNKSGYILREYLEPISEEYDTGLGFSFRFNPNRLCVSPSEPESVKSVRIQWIGYENADAHMEIMLPEAFEEDPQEYMAAHTDYTETFTSTSGTAVTGGTQGNEDYTLSNGFYIAGRGDRTVLITTTCATELEEIADQDFMDLLLTLSIAE